MLRLSLLLLLALQLPAQVLFEDTFHGRGHFDFRIVMDSAPERTGNWVAKMTYLPDGRILMVWCSTAGAELDPTNRIWLATSSDDGATWTQPRVLTSSEGGSKVLNPCTYTHTDGTVFVFYNHGDGQRIYDLWYQTSRDSARTWTPPRRIDASPQVTSLMSNPIRLRTGVILLPFCYDVNNAARKHLAGTVMLSADGGRSWRRGGDMPVDAPRGAMEPSIVELQNGDLYCLLRTKTGFQYESRSQDGGITWSRPQPSPFPSPESCGILLRLAGGPLAYVWNGNAVSQGRQVPRYPLTVALSEDDARSWPYRKVIETTDGARQLSNHGVFQTRSGLILVAGEHFKETRNGVQYGPLFLARFDEPWIRSSVSPEKWDPQPSPTGGIRLDPGGLWLIAGGTPGEVTRLLARTPLPSHVTIEVLAESVTGAPLRIAVPDPPSRWGFFAHHDGAPARLLLREVRVLKNE